MQQACTQCSASFEITDDDLAFYDKVSPVIGGKKFPVPPPDMCPDCRAQRRLAFFNRRHLYKRTSQATGKEIVSIYSPESSVTAYESEYWWSDNWDPLEYGISLSLEQPVFPQLQSLMQAVPRMALLNDRNENCPYVNTTGWAKNCHMCFGADHSEDCMYGEAIYNSKSTLETYYGYNLEQSYECTDCKDCYALFYGHNCVNCSDSLFCHDCIGCKHCVCCAGLRQKQYCWGNEEIGPEEFAKRWQALFPLTASTVKQLRDEYEHVRLSVPHRYVVGTNNEESTGNYLFDSRHAHRCFDSTDLEDCQHCTNVRGAKDCRDMNFWGHPAELCYNSAAVGEGVTRILYCLGAWGGSENMYYCDTCISCHDCFGCFGLRHKQYCIANTQYDQASYEALLTQVFNHMQQTGEWGQLLPMDYTVFAYNETPAHEHWPLTKAEVEARGWRWQDPIDQVSDVQKVIPAAQLPERITDIPDDVLNWAIECEQTGRPYKLTKQELDFYRQHSLPVPRVHPEQRHARRMALRSPRQLWNRQCDKCSQEMQTSYAPERPEQVYCEECYLKEVY